ncbi:AGAP004632-PA [Anopheles gambiae str. PEST]|uniref:AGAP004632-PA n=7 Tax=gambiae species complex TaxID=44542 RepID=Q5TRV9_ANOGA|nr:defensin [Anopheles gambiae]EAL40168.3 AGAP004632-PA [Anopheles gambiae str. PEST]
MDQCSVPRLCIIIMKSFIAAAVIALICAIAVSGTTVTLQSTCKLFTADVVSSITCKMYCVIKGKTGGYCNSEGLCTCRAEDLHFLLKPIINKD